MGRHSRRGRTKTGKPAAPAGGGRPAAREEVPRPHPAPAPPHGTPRHGAPAHAPAAGRSAPAYEEFRAPYEPREGPRVRSGHPEQREPGGGWGVPQQRESGPGVPRRPSAAPPRDAAPGAARMPRQEYVDAFDDGVFGVTGPRTGTGATLPGAGGPGRGGAGPAGAPAAAPAGGDGRDGTGDGGRNTGRGGRGRTLTGVAAAAVTTVLAVVVAGQVADPRGGVREQVGASGESERMSAQDSSRSDVRPTPSRAQSPSAKKSPEGYADRMERLYDLAPNAGGPGELVPVPGRDEAPGDGPVLRYRVDVEKGLPLDGGLFAEAVHRTLNDERSWSHGGARAFERVSGDDEADFVITLASPATTAEWCAKSGLDTTVDNVSCDSAATERVMINAYRWARGSETFGPERIREYREMLINHEVGHRLGMGHVGCPEDGALAPVMMQQTKYLTTGGATCRPNAWPFPDA
ncbi:hypothetical protein GCM10010420_29880 [Streptomyces glaucosporus]|uniref:DUF3152 domain-containing protein n=1 Tax=Streptomyces glaucosporus TaxID=284044 RepID=A0ABN3IEY5_9ACTN